jgi:membrane-associated phospholipid phosphatase
MQQLRSYLPPLFWQISIVFYTIALACYFYFGDKIILFFLNQHYTNWMDVIQVVISFLGRGEVMAVALILLLLLPQFRTSKHAIWVILYGATTIVVTRWLKKLFLVNRPLLVYPGKQLHIVDWTEQAYIYSFPSGHTLGIFSLACFVLLAFNITNRRIQIGLACLCICVGLSRIYLAQHFMSDILFGAVLGIFIGTLFGYFAYQSIYKKTIL